MKIDFEQTIDKMEDIVTLNQELHIPPGTIIMTLYETSPIPLQKELFKKTKAGNHFYRIDRNYIFPADLRKKMIAKQATAMTTTLPAARFVEKMEKETGQPLFHVSKEAYFNLPTSFIVPKGAIWKEEASQVCQRLVQAGVIQKILNFYSARPVIPKTPPPKPFELEHMLFGFMVLAGGVAIALIALLIEIVVTKKQSSQSLVGASQGWLE